MSDTANQQDAAATPAADPIATSETPPVAASTPTPAAVSKPKTKPRKTPDPKVVIRPIAVKAKAKKRHWGLVLSFVVIVCLPVGLSAWYLYTRAADQYATTIGFTVRSEDSTSSADLLSGLGSSIGGGSASRDADILYELILSREIVSRVKNSLDLPTIYSPHYDVDPIMSYNTKGTIEDLTDYWKRMVRVSYDASSGLMEIRVLAFDPQDAQDIALAIRNESSRTINELSAIARADATRYAQEDLDISLDRLKLAREELTSFRLTNQIVDPNADIQAQMGLLTTLQQQQASALIEYDLLSESVRDNDPRLEQAKRRLAVIEARIAEERQKFGAGGVGPGGAEYATIISEFEGLTVDREFAEAAYAASLSALDAARAEANRNSRYLATYISPMKAEQPEFPQRALLIAIVAAFSFLTWAIMSLVYYSLRDRR